MLLLGPIAFQDFEVPETIAFGGRQSMAVHRLPGGARVIDAMGRDDSDLRWSGTFSGPLAADRARALDLLRADGNPLRLIWDAFCYTVVIARYEADFDRPTWIPYRISCTVLADETAQLPSVALSPAAMAVSDAASAAGYDASVADLAPTLAVAGAISAGTQANSQTIAAIAATGVVLDGRVAGAEAAMRPPYDAASLSDLVDGAGELAGSVTARAYVTRAQTIANNNGSR